MFGPSCREAREVRVEVRFELEEDGMAEVFWRDAGGGVECSGEERDGTEARAEEGGGA
jgi:hypothetical protein